VGLGDKSDEQPEATEDGEKNHETIRPAAEIADCLAGGLSEDGEEEQEPEQVVVIVHVEKLRIRLTLRLLCRRRGAQSVSRRGRQATF